MTAGQRDWQARKRRSYAACLDRMAPGLLSGKTERPASEQRDTKTIAYRKLDHGERKEYLIRLISTPGGETAAIHKAGAKAIIEMFEEALSCLTDGIDWLARIDDQYEGRYPDEGCEEPELFFWSEIYEARQPLRGILERLGAVAEYVPKEVAYADHK